MKQKIVYVLGGAGFIGHHLARRKLNQGCRVVVFDKEPNCPYIEDNFSSYCHAYYQVNLATHEGYQTLRSAMRDDRPDEIYNFACVMGGAGFIFTGDHDYEIMTETIQVDLNLLNVIKDLNLYGDVKVFFSSSACIYPQENQLDPENPDCREHTAYPANPDSEYGWTKLYAERLYDAARELKNLDVRVARFHNIAGPEGAWTGGKEKAPAAMCRKVAEANDGDVIEIWGSGEQTRSFLFIEDCLDAVESLMAMDPDDYLGPYNIGSEQMVSINKLARLVMRVANKELEIVNVPGPEGVKGRNSNNDKISDDLGWSPRFSLEAWIPMTYRWIEEKVHG